MFLFWKSKENGKNASDYGLPMYNVRVAYKCSKWKGCSHKKRSFATKVLEAGEVFLGFCEDAFWNPFRTFRSWLLRRWGKNKPLKSEGAAMEMQFHCLYDSQWNHTVRLCMSYSNRNFQNIFAWSFWSLYFWNKLSTSKLTLYGIQKSSVFMFL